MKSLFERLRQASNLLAEKSLSSAGVPVKEKTLKAVMTGQAAEAKKVLEDRPFVITKFPFLIGRDSQNPDADVFYNNDLLIQEEKPYGVSRKYMGSSGLTRLPLDEVSNQVIIGPVTSKCIFLLKVAAL
jgi:hypothetical protein